MNLALAASADPNADHSALLQSLQAVVSALLDLVVLPWRNEACAAKLRALEREVRALRSLLKSGVGQGTAAQRKLWWQTVLRIRTLQAGFLDCIYADGTHGMSRTLLGLLDLDHRLAGVLDALAAWEQQIAAGTEPAADPGAYFTNVLEIAKENNS